MNVAPPFRCSYSRNFPELLYQLGCSLAVSTYQAGKVIFLSAVDADRLVQLPRNFQTPMGMAFDGSRLAVATAGELLVLANAPLLAPLYPQQPNTYDALFLPRHAYFTGGIQAHDVAWGTDGLWIVNTLFSCLARPDDTHSFQPVWQPSFVTELAPEDRCHLNGLALEDGSPRYVTALGATNAEKGWRANKVKGGVVLDVATGEVVLDGLPMPHSPRLYDGNLYVLLSATGELARVDARRGTYDIVNRMPGFVRGMSRLGDYLFVGMSRLRKTSATFGDLPIAKESVFAGVTVVHLPTGSLAAYLRYEASCEEIYDVVVLPGMRRPGLIGMAGPHRRALSLPTAGFWAQEPLEPTKPADTSETDNVETNDDQATNGATQSAEFHDEARRVAELLREPRLESVPDGSLMAKQARGAFRSLATYRTRLIRKIESRQFWSLAASARRALVDRVERLIRRLERWGCVLRWGTIGNLLAAALLGKPLASEASITNFELSYSGTGASFGSVEVGSLSAPALADIDNDGDLDLFVGSSEAGIYYYRNTGSATNPVFTQYLSTDHPFNGIGIYDYSSVAFADMDADGDLDAFVLHNVPEYVPGNYVPGTYYPGYTSPTPPYTYYPPYTSPGYTLPGSTVYFRRTTYLRNDGTATAPDFVPVTGAGNPLNAIDATYTSTNAFGDLDGDGDLDLVMGWLPDGLKPRYFRNTGSPSSPAFTEMTGTDNPFATAEFDAYAYQSPSLGDIDNDGDLDLALGVDGATFLYENVGSAESPQFVFADYVPNSFAYNPGTALGDVDGDGDLDLIVGSSFGALSFFVNEIPHTAALVADLSVNWEMFSLPGPSDEATPAAMANDRGVSTMYGWDPVAQNWTSPISLSSTDPLGFVSEGYFIFRDPGTETAESTTFVVDTFVTEGRDVAVTLQPGWNLVGATFGDISASVLSETPNSVFGFDGANYFVASTLSEFSGYWVYNENDTPRSVTIHRNPVTEGNEPPASPQAVAQSPAWLLPLALALDSGATKTVEIGADRRATDRFDRFDIPLPPAAPTRGYSEIFVSASDRVARLSRSVRASRPSETTWPLVANLAEPGTLRWNAAALPRGHRLELEFDGQRHDLSQSGSLRLTAGRHTLNARLAFEAPKATRLMANFPNPFNPETWIPFELKEASDVTVTVFDLSGNVVRRLDLGYRDAGYYASRDEAAHWDGRNELGERVASGVYVVEFRAGETRELRRVAVQK